MWPRNPILGRRCARHGHQQSDSTGGQDGTEHIQSLAPGGACFPGHARADQRESHRDDGQIDQHHPAPARVLSQQPTHQHTQRSAHGVHPAPHSERAHALRPLGEGGGEHRQRGRHGRGGPQALAGARGDQLPGRLGEPARQRAQSEDDQAEHEQPSAAVEVTCAASQQQKSTERERVGMHDPRQVEWCEPQRGADRGQGDVDHG